jgi:hypothetical protein
MIPPSKNISKIEKHFQERTDEAQISPLRYAPVEMTKGRVVRPSTAVAEQELFHRLGWAKGP